MGLGSALCSAPRRGVETRPWRVFADALRPDASSTATEKRRGHPQGRSEAEQVACDLDRISRVCGMLYVGNSVIRVNLVGPPRGMRSRQTQEVS